jgi:hypothetical protein
MQHPAATVVAVAKAAVKNTASNKNNLFFIVWVS